MAVKNPIAKVVRSVVFRARVVKAKKGRGSYDRKKGKSDELR